MLKERKRKLRKRLLSAHSSVKLQSRASIYSDQCCMYLHTCFNSFDGSFLWNVTLHTIQCIVVSHLSLNIVSAYRLRYSITFKATSKPKPMVQKQMVPSSFLTKKKLHHFHFVNKYFLLHTIEVRLQTWNIFNKFIRAFFNCKQSNNGWISNILWIMGNYKKIYNKIT